MRKDIRNNSVITTATMVMTLTISLFTTINNNALAIVDNNEYYELKFQRQDLLAREQDLLKDRQELSRALQEKQGNRNANPQDINELASQLDDTTLELNSVRNEITQVEMDMRR